MRQVPSTKSPEYEKVSTMLNHILDRMQSEDTTRAKDIHQELQWYQKPKAFALLGLVIAALGTLVGLFIHILPVILGLYNALASTESPIDAVADIIMVFSICAAIGIVYYAAILAIGNYVDSKLAEHK